MHNPYDYDTTGLHKVSTRKFEKILACLSPSDVQKKFTAVVHSKRPICSKNRWWYRITRQGNIADVVAMNFRPRPQIKKLSKEQYVFTRTGEVKNFMPNENRNKRSLRKIFKELRQTITANFQSDVKNQLSITLTYAENMQDPKRVHSDFKKFFQKLKRAYKEHKLDYLVVVEPQGRGAWHCHLLLKSDQPVLFIPDEEISALWGNGFTKTERLKNVDNAGAYFIAYFSNLELSDDYIAEFEVDKADIVEREGKRFIKGERLKFYPDYMQIWRHSRGVVKPVVADITKSDLKAEFGSPVYRKDFLFETKDKVLEIITTQHKK